MERARSIVPSGQRRAVTPGEAKPSCEERLERALDEALEETFPASDPPALIAPGPHCPDWEKSEGG
jgi:hypothetical protein